MSDALQHECGLAVVRLKKPLSYFAQKYGSPLWGFEKLFLLMEKQHNRGQDGVGIGCVKQNVLAGRPYMFRDRQDGPTPLAHLFNNQLAAYNAAVAKGVLNPEDPASVAEHFNYGGELLIGHLRYATSGQSGKECLHPYVRRSGWRTRSLLLAGNFTLTNSAQMNRSLMHRGQHPTFATDTQTLLDEISYQLDEAHSQKLVPKHKAEHTRAPMAISNELSLRKILKNTAHEWDGGFAICGVVGDTQAFLVRDAHGIRPLHYVETDEFFAAASERVALMTGFDVAQEAVHAVPPGGAILLDSKGNSKTEQILKPQPLQQCSFERIYFSRGNDPEIYNERKALGAALAPQISKLIHHDFTHAVFSYIPNTSEVGFMGLIAALRRKRREQVRDVILEAQKDGVLDETFLDNLMEHGWLRTEKVATKDVKLRTFIAQETDRLKMASHVYDITYGTVQAKDTLVVVDDSIVRGTTLRQSVLRMLTRFNPKHIIIASTAPQIRYPDCYGIDMSEIGKFIAFKALMALLKEDGRQADIDAAYAKCQRYLEGDASVGNPVQELYALYTEVQVSEKIAQLVRPAPENSGGWQGKLTVCYQTVQALHAAIPQHTGSWYFTGNYPTPGGLRVLCQAFVNFYEGNTAARSY